MRGLAHCPCCTPAVCAKGWRACGGGPVCKRGEDVAHPGRRGLPANREEGAWRTVSPAPWQARKGQGRRAGRVNVGVQSLVRWQETTRGGDRARPEGGAHYQRSIPICAKRAGEETGGATSGGTQRGWLHQWGGRRPAQRGGEEMGRPQKWRGLAHLVALPVCAERTG